MGAPRLQRLRRLVWKEFLELHQNPRLFGIVIIAPIIQLTMLGYAASTDVRDVPVVVADGDRSPESRSLIARFDASRNFTVIDTVTTVGEVDEYLQRGRAWMALGIPSGYGSAIHTGRPVAVQAIADGTDSNSTTVALGYATSLIGEYALELLEEPPNPRTGNPELSPEPRTPNPLHASSRHYRQRPGRLDRRYLRRSREPGTARLRRRHH